MKEEQLFVSGVVIVLMLLVVSRRELVDATMKAICRFNDRLRGL
jgi:hypothetical protein